MVRGNNPVFISSYGFLTTLVSSALRFAVQPLQYKLSQRENIHWNLCQLSSSKTWHKNFHFNQTNWFQVLIVLLSFVCENLFDAIFIIHRFVVEHTLQIWKWKQRFALHELNEMNTVLKHTSVVENVELNGSEWEYNWIAGMNIGLRKIVTKCGCNFDEVLRK